MFYFETSRKPDSLLIWRICAAGSPLTTANVILFFPLLLVFPVVTCRSIASMLRPLTLWKLPRQQTGTLHIWKRSFFFLFLSLFFVRSEKELGWRKQIGRWPRTAFVWAPDLWEPIFMEGFTLAEGLLRGIRARNKQEIFPVVNGTRQVQIYTAPFNPNIGTGWRRSGLYQHEKFWARTMKVRKKRHFRVQVVV